MTKKISMKALLLGVLLIPLNCYWVVKSEIVIASLHATVLSIFFNVPFTIFILSLLNRVAAFLKAPFLKPEEILTVYVMLAVSTGLFGIDLMTLLVPIMGHAFWFATPENEWQELFWRYLPNSLVVSDRTILRGYYEGGSSFWLPVHLSAWVKPVGAWLIFIFALFSVCLYINAILRKQWVEHERLSYPVIQLPLEMVSERFFKNRLMWLGFGIGFTLDLFAGLHELFPVVPVPRVKWYNLGPLFTGKPWDAIGWLPIHFYPFVTGLGYMMPLDLSFSLWFFYLFWKIQVVFTSAVGWKLSGSYLGWQKAGAWLGIGILGVWTSRKQIKFALSKALRGDATEEGEPMSYRNAIGGLLLGFGVIIIFWTHTGVGVLAVIAFFILYLIFSLAATRMRAELGPPTHELHFAGPDQILTALFGSRRFSPQTFSGFALLYWTNYGYRCHPMPHQLEGFKIAEQSKLNPKSLFGAMMLATFIGILSAFLVLLTHFYKYGAVSRVHGGSLGPSWETFSRLATLMATPTQPDASIIKQIGFGLIVTIFLMFMRRQFLWWQLHPVGYAVASGWSISWMWFSVFLGWLAKTALLKGGGLKTHRKAVPFFLGLILGQFIIGSLWSILSLILDRKIYSFFV